MNESVEDFFTLLQYVSGIEAISISPSEAHVIIDDSEEPECGELTHFRVVVQYCMAFTFLIAGIFVGNEFSLYTTSEGIGQVDICAVLMDPGPATAP